MSDLDLRTADQYCDSISKSHSSEYFLVQERIAKEIQHGRFLAEHGAGEIWNWESPAGKLRWARRVKMLSSHLEAGNDRA